MNKFIKKISMALMIIFSILQIIIATKSVKATTIGYTTYLKRAEKGFYSIQKWTGSNWTYIVHSITNYIDENGIERVAYCVNPDLNGIGYIEGEYEGYDVKLKELLSDQRLWRVYTNGYPYKTPADLEVENEQDAYLATKQAAYCIIRGYSVDEVRTLYRAGEDPVEGESLDEIKRRGQKIIDAMCKLVDIGYNGSETMQTNNLLKIEKVGDFSVDSNNKKYYSQNYKVTSSVDYSEYSIQSIESFPEGSYVANINSEQKSTFSSNELFKVMIPKDSILDNVTGTINIKGKCQNYPIYYAECESGNYQNYILCCDTYSNDITASIKTDINAYESKLQIQKTDKDTGSPIKGVKFSVKYENGEDIGVFETDKDGKILIQNLKQGNIQIKEIETDEKYVLNNEINKVKLNYNELKTVKLQNEMKKAGIKIIKVDAENNKIRIPNVKFEIYDENKNLIETLTTDERGEAVIDDLPIYIKYTIKEIETAEEYELNSEVVTIKLEENQIKTLTFKNSKKPTKENENEETTTKKTLPRTGGIDVGNYLFGMAVMGCIFKKKQKIQY